MLALLSAIAVVAPALAQTLGTSNSLRQEFRSTGRSIEVSGVGCGTSSSGSLTLDKAGRGQSKAYDLRVRRPAVGNRDGFVRVTGVSVNDQTITVTAVADNAECTAEASGPPAQERWRGIFSDPDISFFRRVQVRMQRSLISHEAKPPVLRPRRMRLNFEESLRRIRWKRFGGRTATGTATYRLRIPRGCNPRRCPGLKRSLALNGRRMTVKLSRVKRCPTLEYTRVRVIYRGKTFIPTGTFCGRG